MSEFSDRPFVAGNVTGLRAFRIDTLGRLTGVTHRDVWVPGENQAVCHAPKGGTFAYGGMVSTSANIIWNPTTSDFGFDRKGKKSKRIPQIPTPGEKAAKLAHVLSGVACQCGFYAYFDGGNDYLIHTSAPTPQQSYGGIVIWAGDPDPAPRVGAIVNGWGVVTVGTRGFRAEKAEVVALISPTSEQAKHEVAFTKVRRNYPHVQVFSTEVEAVRAFPLTDPHPYSPETDEDFWTRSAS